LAAVPRQQQFLADGFQYAVGILKDIVIPEAQDVVAECLDNFGAGGVDFGRVLAPVKLDREVGVAAGEVGDMRADRELADEFCAFELAGAEVRPKSSFRVGAARAKLARNRRQSFFRQCRAPSPNPLPAGERAFAGPRQVHA